jgi:hypothetical protein
VRGIVRFLKRYCGFVVAFLKVRDFQRMRIKVVVSSGALGFV